jgi:hypothetical protein
MVKVSFAMYDLVSQAPKPTTARRDGAAPDKKLCPLI